jgi:hypothetical protein
MSLYVGEKKKEARKSNVIHINLPCTVEGGVGYENLDAGVFVMFCA